MDFFINKSSKIKENSLSNLKQILFERLHRKGMEKDIIPSFIRSMKICFVINSNVSQLQVNKQLQSLGWNDFEVDYHTLQLAIACFETKEVKDK